MMLVVCTFVIATAQPDCSNPMPDRDAVAYAIVGNLDVPFTTRSTRTPYTVYPADAAPTSH
jgi:hypothetical protein